MAQGWKIFANLAIAYDLMDFKVYRKPENNAKEITIYCDYYQNPAGVIHFQSFLKALNEKFKEAGIKFVNPVVLKDSLIVSDFINARNDYSDDLARDPSSIPGAPNGYISNIHILFLKDMHALRKGSYGSMNDVDEIFRSILEKHKNDHKAAVAIYQSPAFKAEIKFLFDKIKEGSEPNWYNIAKERDFLHLLDIKNALAGNVKEKDECEKIQEKSKLLGFPSREQEEELRQKKPQTKYKEELKQQIKQLQDKISRIEKDKKNAIKAQANQGKKAINPDLLVQKLERAQSALDDTIQIMTTQIQEARAELAVREKERQEYKRLSSQEQAEFLMDKDPAFKAKAELYAEVRSTVREAILHEPQFKGVTIDPQLLNSAIMYSLAKLEGASDKDAAKKLVNWTIGKDGVPKPKEKNCPLTMSMIHNMSYTAYLAVADQTIEKMKSDKEVKTDMSPPSPSPLRLGTP